MFSTTFSSREIKAESIRTVQNRSNFTNFFNYDFFDNFSGEIDS